MRAIEITIPGGPEVLTPVRRIPPVPMPGEVWIRGAAAGVNRPDIFQRLGRYAPPLGTTDIPGLEVAGTVEALGPDRTDERWRVGHKVPVAGGGRAVQHSTVRF